MFVIAPEQPGDEPAIETLLNSAFGPDRLNKASYRYRQGIAPLNYLGLTARDGDHLVGTIRYWPVTVGASWPKGAKLALLLGPLAIDPGRRGEGIGVALMKNSLSRAAAAGHPLAVLAGDLAYYRRAGFELAVQHDITMPEEAPERLLVRELVPGSLLVSQGQVKPWREGRGLAAFPSPGQNEQTNDRR